MQGQDDSSQGYSQLINDCNPDCHHTDLALNTCDESHLLSHICIFSKYLVTCLFSITVAWGALVTAEKSGKGGGKGVKGSRGQRRG